MPTQNGLHPIAPSAEEIACKFHRAAPPPEVRQRLVAALAEADARLRTEVEASRALEQPARDAWPEIWHHATVRAGLPGGSGRVSPYMPALSEERWAERICIYAPKPVHPDTPVLLDHVDTGRTLFEPLGNRVLSRGAVPANGTIVTFFGIHQGRRTGLLEYSPEAGLGVADTIPFPVLDEISRIMPHLEEAIELKGEALVRWTRAAYGLARARDLRGDAEHAIRAHDFLSQANVRRPTEVWRGYYMDEPLLQELFSIFDLYRDGHYSGGIVAAGPTGTGKTRFFELASQFFEMPFFVEDSTTILSPHPGKTGERIAELLAKAREAAPSVIYIDDGERVFPNRELPHAVENGLEAVAAFLSQWKGVKDDEPVLVVVSTNRPEAMDSAIVRRFGRRVDFPTPSAEARAGILRDALRAKGIDMPLTIPVVRATAGLSGGWLHNVADQTQVIARSRNEEARVEHLLDAIQQVRRQNGTKVDPNARWDCIVLDSRTKEELKRVVRVLPYTEEARKQGVSIPNTLLLEGPPGTGKTLLAKVIANESGAAFFALDSTDFLGQFQGHTGPKVKAAFRKLRESSPSVGFVDEITTFLGQPGGGGYEEQLLGMLLTELDGIAEEAGNYLLIAATNHIEQIPPALLSRFPRRIHIGLPDEEQRAKGLVLQLAGKRTHFQVEKLARTLAPRMVGWSQRDIARFVEDGGVRALDRATRRSEAAGEPLRLVMELEDLDIARLMTAEERARSVLWPAARQTASG